MGSAENGCGLRDVAPFGDARPWLRVAGAPSLHHATARYNYNTVTNLPAIRNPRQVVIARDSPERRPAHHAAGRRGQPQI
jgi:hypothetical protein